MVVAFAVPLPYYTVSPGPARSTEGHITVKGHRSYSSKGEVLYTTVSSRQATAALLLQAALDRSIDVIGEKEANPTGDREAEVKVERAEMDQSKLAALVVALDRIGQPATITSTGARIVEVASDVPAARVLRTDDVIVSIDGRAIGVLDEIATVVAGHRPGERVTMTIRRGQRTVEVGVPLASDPDDPSRARIGVHLTPENQKVALPFDVDLDSGQVGGPSAGLAWTLGVIDRLTPGDLTGGKVVAVTGTIDSAGRVGPIGGIAQKAVGAKRVGATEFVYPKATSPADVARLRSVADGLRLIPVATVDDALKALDPTGSRH
ncbi:MAG: PDZ domain-containing protein [Microthrixaceae bacterium]